MGQASKSVAGRITDGRRIARLMRLGVVCVLSRIDAGLRPDAILWRSVELQYPRLRSAFVNRDQVRYGFVIDCSTSARKISSARRNGQPKLWIFGEAAAVGSSRGHMAVVEAAQSTTEPVDFQSADVIDRNLGDPVSDKYGSSIDRRKTQPCVCMSCVEPTSLLKCVVRFF